MSIYALPGPLFKLVSSARSSSSAKPKSSVEVAAKDTGTTIVSSVEGHNDVVGAAANNPLKRRPNSGSSGSTLLLDVSPDHSNASHCGTRNLCRNSNVCIAVKEATIDPERLIRSLSLSGNDAKKNSTSTNNKPGGDACDSVDDAIQFEISVAFNGREYTATRTLPRMLQFRYDLIEEFRTRRMWRERRRKRKAEKIPQMAKVRDLSDDEEEEKSIPELPRLSEDAAGGRGFTMLNALLRPYGPALDRWLQKVIDIVPHDSQCLTQFLWEPLAGNATSKKERRRSSHSTLVAIQETEDLEQYDSDTDDYLLNSC